MVREETGSSLWNNELDQMKENEEGEKYAEGQKQDKEWNDTNWHVEHFWLVCTGKGAI